MYNIIKNWVKELPQIPYYGGKPKGVVLHDTANTATASQEVAYMSTNWNNAFVHGFVDGYDIIECANPDFICWGAGHTANQYYMQIELCRVKNITQFHTSFDRWTWYAAYLLFKHNLPVIDGVTLVSHAWVSKNLGGTDHTDPVGYLVQWGKSWNDVVDSVQKWYNQIKGGVNVSMTADEKQQLADTTATLKDLIQEVHELGEQVTPVSCPQWAQEAFDYLNDADVVFEPKQPMAVWRALTIMYRAHQKGAM